jgi:hypothetical protein
MAGAAEFLDSRPMNEAGCLYYRASGNRFVTPLPGALRDQGLVTHYGRAGGILPRPA